MSRLNCASLIEFYEMIERPFFVAFFTNPTCGVCSVVEPKFEELMERYPEADWIKVVPADQPDIAAQNMIFQVPAVIMFEDGRETFRQIRVVHVADVEDKLGTVFDK